MSPKEVSSGVVSERGPASGSRSSAVGLDMRLTFLLWHNPDWDSTVPLPRWFRVFQPQDLLWVLLFGIMIALSPVRDVSETTMLVVLGILQIVEPKLSFVRTNFGRGLWIVLKLALVYLLIGYTGGLL